MFTCVGGENGFGFSHFCLFVVLVGEKKCADLERQIPEKTVKRNEKESLPRTRKDKPKKTTQE